MAKVHSGAGAKKRSARVELVAGCLVGLRGGRRVLSACASALEGLALGGLSAEELSEVTGRAYALSRASSRSKLFAWEKRWFDQDLPVEARNVLLGAAGSDGGAELSWLRKRSQHVFAFDPIGNETDVARGRYEDLLATSRLRASVEAKAPFDAVVLGWGSLSHIVESDDRRALMRQLRSWCSGPILISYWPALSTDGTESARARRLGEAVGKALTPGASRVRRGDSFLEHCGYIHRFSEEELCALADEAKSDLLVRTRPGDYAHATLAPR